MKSFTLVEILVVVGILGLVMAGLAMILNSGYTAYNINSCLLDLQQNARLSMDWMVREIREGAPSTINISPDATRITFDTPNETGIAYYLDSGNNRIIRRFPANTTRIIANNIVSLNFSLNGNLLGIQVTARRADRPDLSFFLREQVRLRNE